MVQMTSLGMFIIKSRGDKYFSVCGYWRDTERNKVEFFLL